MTNILRYCIIRYPKREGPVTMYLIQGVGEYAGSIVLDDVK